MILAFAHNFTPLSNAALRGTGSQTIFRNIQKGGVESLLLRPTCNLSDISGALACKGWTFVLSFDLN